MADREQKIIALDLSTISGIFEPPPTLYIFLRPLRPTAE